MSGLADCVMPDVPRRVQRGRWKGFRVPPNTVSVVRGTRFGNPFVCDDPADAVALYRAWITQNPALADMLLAVASGVLIRGDAGLFWRQQAFNGIANLRGKNLACWCAENAPCHADVLLELANWPGSTQP